ncbi:MAG TPA: hypothetical protein VNL72_05620 [Gammaproteobacteria bacterium]|nr:hypothetical protein [Gammaproteobacteria bacterium]
MPVALTIGFALLLAAAHAPLDEMARRYEQALAARARGDFMAMEQELRGALALRPGHPRLLYTLAATRALRGDPAEAVAILTRLANMGLSYDPAQDPDFAGIAAFPGFRPVAERLARNAAPLVASLPAFGLAAPTFMPEGLAYDETSGAFFVGSVRERRILRVPPEGPATSFADAARGGLWSVLALHVDRSRGWLWAASAALPPMDGFEPSLAGRSGLFAFALADGAPVATFVLEEPGEHLLGELAIAPDGMVYATDSLGGALYALDVNQGVFTRLTPPGALLAPRGLAFDATGARLYVADHAAGVRVFDRHTGTLAPLVEATDVCTFGIAGLYRHGTSLIAIQNGIRPNRVLRMDLDESGTRIVAAVALEANHPQYGEPTLGVIVGDSLYYIANSPWQRFDTAGRLPPATELRDPQILRLPLRQP